ncbi:Hypothetical predicted protein [Mytilus galloprovincialis]|uniref:Galaxin-like repeats domain-containing protein n=1 Tax=Mytilus galloprovincialis TaxID=29158 RepID=A0A8B6EKN3_MYTGA|nr:Hypothetical predicted protein [Mytilus galloprovincialis]
MDIIETLDVKMRHQGINSILLFALCNYSIGVRTKYCLGKDGRLRPYNDLNEGCCNSGIYNKTVGADNFACCDGSYQVYNIRTHFCCENQLRRIQDEKQSYECCKNELRDKKIGVCCENVYYEQGRNGECCGQLLNKRNQYFCCKDKSSISAKLHQKTSNQKCCGINSYNKKTNNKENGCCEGVPYSTITSDCSHGHVVPKGHAWCSSDKIMGEQYKCCDGLRLDTSKYVCCGEEKISKITGYENKCCLVNGNKELYDASKQTCTQKGVVGQLSVTSSTTSKPDMCGWNTYNRFVDLCCQGILVEKGIVNEMQCCGVRPYFTTNQTCLDGVMRNNSLNSVSIIKDEIHDCIPIFEETYSSLIYWPSLDEWQELQGGWGKLPFAVGAIDGTSTEIYRPITEPQEQYYSGYR